MFNIFRKIIGLFIASFLFFSISSTSFAIDKLHFLIGGGAGGGWDRPLTAIILSGTILLVSWQTYKGLKK